MSRWDQTEISAVFEDNDELSQQRMEDLMVEAAQILSEDEVPETRPKPDAKSAAKYNFKFS